jgi:hypothetical protein
MALSLKTPTVVQSNDLTTLVVTDTTGAYNVSTNPGGWGTPNASTTDINEEAYNTGCYIGITRTSTDGTVIEYQPIYLANPSTVTYQKLQGTYTTVTDLVYNITSYNLVELTIDGVGTGDTAPIGTSTDELPEGWYSILYWINCTELDSITTVALLCGTVRLAIYYKLREVPYVHEFKFFSNDYKEWDGILIPVYLYSLYQGMQASVSDSRKTLILDTLSTLQRLTT